MPTSRACESSYAKSLSVLLLRAAWSSSCIVRQQEREGGGWESAQGVGRATDGQSQRSGWTRCCHSYSEPCANATHNHACRSISARTSIASRDRLDSRLSEFRSRAESAPLSGGGIRKSANPVEIATSSSVFDEASRASCSMRLASPACAAACEAAKQD
eukprot:6209057-Pleurochrysis_carterae.AAC.2